MEDKFFDIDEAMVEYAELSGFNFNSASFLEVNEECTQQPLTFKYGQFDMLDMLKSMFAKPELSKH